MNNSILCQALGYAFYVMNLYYNKLMCCYDMEAFIIATYIHAFGELSLWSQVKQQTLNRSNESNAALVST
jgi:hypothetical protein